MIYKIFLSLSFIICILLSSCDKKLSKDEIIKQFKENEDIYNIAARTNNYTKIKKLKGVKDIYKSNDYIRIIYETKGLVSGGSTYGIYYSNDDSLCAIDLSPSCEELKQEGNGYRYKQKNGDNEYYVEKIGNHYYYFEAHF